MADRVIYRLWEPPQALTQGVVADTSPGTSPDPSPGLRRRSTGTASWRSSEMCEESAAAAPAAPPAAAAPTAAPAAAAAVAVARAPLLKLAMHAALVVALHATYNAAGLSLWTCEDDVDSDCVGAPDGTDAADAAGGAPLSDAALEGSACCKRGYVRPIFYLLSCVYLYLSALQLQRGMPLVVRDHPYATQGSNPGLADPSQVCHSHVCALPSG